VVQAKCITQKCPSALADVTKKFLIAEASLSRIPTKMAATDVFKSPGCRASLENSTATASSAVYALCEVGSLKSI
jgi:hypothetical protein